jgi:hypothetical protein
MMEAGAAGEPPRRTQSGVSYNHLDPMGSHGRLVAVISPKYMQTRRLNHQVQSGRRSIRGRTIAGVRREETSKFLLTGDPFHYPSTSSHSAFPVNLTSCPRKPPRRPFWALVTLDYTSQCSADGGAHGNQPGKGAESSIR